MFGLLFSEFTGPCVVSRENARMLKAVPDSFSKISAQPRSSSVRNVTRMCCITRERITSAGTMRREWSANVLAHCTSKRPGSGLVPFAVKINFASVGSQDSQSNRLKSQLTKTESGKNCEGTKLFRMPMSHIFCPPGTDECTLRTSTVIANRNQLIPRRLK
jgi:hypothetical protein